MVQPHAEPVITVADLRMSYGDVDVLRGIGFTLRRGEIVALLGPNGAGKTTTIEILEGFRIRSGGEVRVLGEDPAVAGEDWRARVGVVLQSWRDHGRWRVRELLEQLGAFYAPYATPSRRRPYPIGELIELVGLGAHAEQKIASLSGGQRRRLDVAIGIVGRPELLFLDEPTAGFDPVARRDFHDLIHRLSDVEETAILLTTHDLAEAEKVADRILILDRGVIVADGSPDELARRISGKTEVRWTQAGTRHVHSAADGTAFARSLFEAHGESIEDLEVRRFTLEDTYLQMIAAQEAPGRPALAALDGGR